MTGNSVAISKDLLADLLSIPMAVLDRNLEDSSFSRAELDEYMLICLKSLLKGSSSALSIVADNELSEVERMQWIRRYIALYLDVAPTSDDVRAETVRSEEEERGEAD